ncbi:hypothetical protein ACLB2K_012506 [Fragaria x ananassa]
MSTEERHIFYSAVVQVPTRRPFPTVTGNIPVSLRLYKETRFWFDGPEDYEDVVPRTLVAGEGFLGCRERVSRIAAQQLLQMPIPEQEVPPIIDKLVQKLSVVSEVIDWVARQTFSYLGHPFRGGEVIGEPSASYKANRTPAATSFIHGLKRLRLDSLEEAVIRETPTCAICLQDFAESAEELITCLPCKHHYHVNCIVLCLEINHICPLCRYPMPTAEACEPLTNAATAN